MFDFDTTLFQIASPATKKLRSGKIVLNRIQHMHSENEVTAENLKLIRTRAEMSQSEVGDLLGIASNQISKIESGLRSLSAAEKRLLDWYFFGRIPHQIVSGSTDLKGCLEFDEFEWKVICILATRNGFSSPGKWIAAQIHGYLDNHSKAQAAKSEARAAGYTDTITPSLRVAEDEAPYKIRKTGTDAQ